MSCIDEETLGAFVEGNLDAQRRVEVMEHLETCRPCTVAAGLAAESLREEGTAPQRSLAPWWLAAAAVLATALLGMALFRERIFGSPMRTLVAAAPADHRLLEPRLTGGFAYAEYRGPARDVAPSKSDPERLKLQGAAGQVLDRSRRDPSAETAHAAGVALLLIDDPAQAIERLRAAAGDDAPDDAPDDANVWSDLAAAYYASARPSLDPQALAAADRALAIDAGMAEALFNRALVLERMGLLAEARKAWERYLEADPSSPWASEARAHLARLGAHDSSFQRDLPRLSAEELVARYPQEARTWGEGPFLAQWAEGNAESLARARAIGDALAKRSNETLLRDAVAAIDHARDPRPLIEGHLAYRDGRIAYSRRELVPAQEKLQRAADALMRGGSPMALAARYFAANVVYDLNRPEESFAELTRILAVTPQSHRALRAQILWQRALCSSTLAHWSRSVEDGEEARKTFDALGEESNRAFVDVIVAQALAFSEDDDRAWERRSAAFAVFSRIANGERLAACLGAAIYSEVHDGHLAAARALADIQVAAAQQVPNRGLLAAALLQRALIRHRAGEGQAMLDVAAARAITPHTGDSARIGAETDFAEGVIARGSDPRRAIVLLTRSADFARAAFPPYLPAALLERGRAYRDLGDLDRAWTDLTGGIDDLEARRDPRASNELDTSGLFDDEQNLFSAAVGVALQRGDTAAAFAYADRALQHALRSRFPAARRAPGIEPPDRGQALVQIHLDGEAVHLFCVTPDGITTARGGEAGRIRGDVRALAGNRRDFDTPAASLYGSLIAPIRDSLAGARSLVIVSDPRLGFIPFAALFDAGTKRYLVEDFEIAGRPASGVPLQQRAAVSADAPALVISDPAGTPLPGAAREGRAVAENYRTVETLAGPSATTAAVLRGLATHRVVHYAGHAAAEERVAGAMLLADGRLYASDIARLDLGTLDLVVLAACRSSRAAHEVVPRDLATAFLVAGARNVVATGWEIDDETSVDLFSQLHRAVSAGERVAAALRHVQLAAIRAHQPPAAWGAITILSVERSQS